jgi:hypothetical protein
MVFVFVLTRGVIVVADISQYACIRTQREGTVPSGRHEYERTVSTEAATDAKVREPDLKAAST